MLSPIAAAILIQTTCLVGLLAYVRHKWATSAGFILVVTAWSYHAGSEILNALFPDRNSYRTLVTADETGAAALWCAAVIASFTAAYLLSRPYRAHSAIVRPKAPKPKVSALEEWRVLAAVALPLYLLALSPAEFRADRYWQSGIMDQFVVISVVLTSLAMTRRASWRATAAVMCVQAAMLVFVGTRTAVALALVMFLSATARRRPEHQLRLIAVAAGLVISAAVVISAARTTVGREDLSYDAASRANGIRAGAQALWRPTEMIDGVLDDAVYRLDGNSFAALIMDRLKQGAEPVGPQLLLNAGRLAVPTFLFPAKMDLSLEARNEKALIEAHFRIMPGIDYVPTVVSILLATFGFLGAVLAAGVIGGCYGCADRYLNRSSSALSLLLSLGLVQCALQSEQGIVIYFVVFRGVAVVAVIASCVDFFRAPTRKRVGNGPATPAIQRRHTRARPLVNDARSVVRSST